MATLRPRPSGGRMRELINHCRVLLHAAPSSSVLVALCPFFAFVSTSDIASESEALSVNIAATATATTDTLAAVGPGSR